MMPMDDDEWPWEKALKNRLVLQNIFKFLPTGFLLSSCSLVNKTWNNEACTVIRNSRRCTVAMTGSCECLRNFDQFCGEIAENGRLVPFNSFIFKFKMGDGLCRLASSDDHVELIRNMTSSMNFLHFHIDCRNFLFPCRAHQPLFLLLQHKSNQLRSLKIEGASFFGAALGLGSADWEPNFPHLKFIGISNVNLYRIDSSPDEEALEIIQKIIKGAPNLDRIVAADLEALRMVPVDKYKYLEKIQFDFNQLEDDTLYEKIIKAKPRLKRLSIFPLTPRRDDEFGAHNAPGHDDWRFRATLENLLESCHQNLQTISIFGAYEELSRLSHPPLVNLTKLRIATSNIYNTISRIDYANKMPGLKKVEFVAPLVEPGAGRNMGAEDPSCCLTVRNLTVTMCASAGDFLSLFESMFPNISSLKIIFRPETEAIPFSKICELWPHLEELEIRGKTLMLRKNYDSEFCGMHLQEVGLLRQKNSEFLKTVNIVPGTYSILSLKSLRKLRVDLKFVDRYSPAPDFQLLSKVTELVVFRKMPDVDISVSWCYANLVDEDKYSIILPADTINSRLSKKVFQEPRLLNKIFSYIPTSSLLSSCSLVNTDWNGEVRKFVVENRKSTARMTAADSTCQLVRELDQLCCQMSNEGRVIPWNGLQVNFSSCNGVHTDDVIALQCQLRPKYLELHWKFPRWGADCSVHKPLEALLRQCASGLRIFKIGNLPPSFGHVLSGCTAGFPKLEKIIVSSLRDLELRSDERSALNQILSRIFQNAPLQKIIAEDTESLEIIPEHKYGLLHELKFHLRCIKDENLYLKVAEGRPALRKLQVYQPFPIQVYGKAPVRNFKETFNKSLEQLLHACHWTLEMISIESVYSLSQLSFPPLENLRKLKLNTRFGPLQNFSNALISIDYGRNMPALEELEIKMSNLVEMDITSREYLDGDVAWPSFDENQGSIDMLCRPNNVRKLTLELHVKKINFSLLSSIFPKVTSLEIRGRRSIRLKPGALPWSEIFQFLPNLEELRISGARNFLRRNYDSDLCGIYEEEAGFLQNMDIRFLRNVQIVPVKPSLLSMTRLQKCWVEPGIDSDSEPNHSGPSESFEFTVVAELLAFRRTPHLTVSFG